MRVEADDDLGSEQLVRYCARRWLPVERYRRGPFTLDPEGIGAALRAATEGRRPPPVSVDRALPDRRVLGDALPLAAACALAEPCDLGTMDALRQVVSPELPYLAMQRILALWSKESSRAAERASSSHRRARRTSIRLSSVGPSSRTC